MPSFVETGIGQEQARTSESIMGVDRARRDQLASILAGYMRGEMTTRAACARLHELDRTSRSRASPQCEGDTAFDLILYGWELGLETQNPEGFSRTQWESCRRDLAYLASNLEEE